MSQDFLNVLSALMSTDNNARRAAEEYYHSQMEANLESSLNILLQIFSEASYDVVIRSFAGILIRRTIEKYSTKLSAETNAAFRLRLMNLWAVEKNRNLIQRLSHMMAQSALKTPWTDLLPKVIEYSATLEGAAVVPVLNLIEIVSEYCPDDILAHLQTLGTFMGKFLAATDPLVQVACAKATVACIIALEDDTARNAFKPALEPVINVLGAALSRGDESSATSIMENLVTVAQMQPTFFKASIDMVVAALLSVAGNADSFEFSTRSMALEVMVTLTETAPAIARRCPGLAEGLIPLAMKMSLEVEEEDADWARGKYTEEPSEDENCSVGDEAVERVAAGLGGRVVTIPVLSIVQSLSGHNRWEGRRAAVAGLCRLAEGSVKTFKKHLPDALPFLSGALQDKAARVKFEGIQTIGRFASLFPESVGDMVDRFLPALTMLLQDSHTCDRVRGHAAAALIDLLNPEHCEAEALQKYLDPLLNSLVYCLQSAPLEVQAPCLVLLGCIAQVVSEGFAPYYSAFMPGIKSVMMAATAPDQAALRGKAMGCASLVGDAVGVELFAQDAMEIMQLLIQAIHQDTERDITFEYILPACVRISKALGTHFEPFLPVVIEPLLAGATQVTHFSIEDANDDDVEGEVTHDDETGTESAVVSLGAGVRKRVTLNTHAVQQKNQAARIIFEFAVSMRGYLRNYISPLLQAVLGLAADKHSSDIRSSAALALSKTFEAFVHAVQMGFLKTSQGDMDEVLLGCLSKILDCIRNESDGTARACSTEAFRDILLACFTSGEENADGFRVNLIVKPSLALSQNIMKEVLAQCAESMLRRKAKEDAIASNAGFDAEDREAAAEQLEEEEELLTSLADALGQLLKLHGPEFMTIFDTVIAPAFSVYLNPEHPASLQIIAVCLVDDAIEFGGAPATKYIPTLLNTLVRNLSSEDNVLRQCSMYGIARAAYAAPEVLKQHLGVVIPALAQCIAMPGADEDDNVGTVENAIFAVGCMVSELAYRDSFAPAGVTVESLATLWLQRLPLTADEKEAKTAARQLCDCIERNDAAVLGTNNANVQHILRIFAEVLQSVDEHAQAQNPQVIKVDEDAPIALAHAATAKRMAAILKQFAAGAVSGQVLMEGYSQLPAELQAVLKAHSA